MKTSAYAQYIAWCMVGFQQILNYWIKGTCILLHMADSITNRINNTVATKP